MNHVMFYAAQPRGGKPNSTVIRSSAYSYKTLQASKWPCTCRYVYGGVTTKYGFLQYGHRTHSTFTAGDLPTAGTLGSPGQAGNWVNTLINALGDKLLTALVRKPGSADVLPDYVVANEYQDSSKCIGYHSDSDPLFGTADSETVIFSFNLSRDGIFCLKPGSTDNEFAKFVGMGKRNKDDWLLPVYAPENSVIIMGGWCQVCTEHCTLAHNSVVDGSAPELQGQLGQQVRTEYMDAGRYCLEGSPRQAWNLKCVELVVPQILTNDYKTTT